MNISPKTTKMNMSPIFCRFCASSKPSGELRDLTAHIDTLEDVKKIIGLLGINFVKMSDDALPKAICDICYRNLKTCCQVFEIARQSQKVLSKMFSENEGRHKNVTTDYNSPSMLEREKEVAQILAELSLGILDKQHNSGTSQQPEYETFEQQPQPVDIPEQPLKPAGVRQQPLETAGVSQQSPEAAGIPQHPIKPGSTPQSDHKAGTRIKIRNPIWATYPTKCDQCGVSCTTILGLLEHRQSAHGLPGFQCVDCPMTVPTFLAFIEHVQAHRPELLDNCPICHLKTDDRIHILSHPEALVDHKLSGSPKIDGVKRKKTDIRDRCKFFGGAKIRRESNCWSDHSWVCCYCNKKFQDQPDLRSHIMEQHS